VRWPPLITTVSAAILNWTSELRVYPSPQQHQSVAATLPSTLRSSQACGLSRPQPLIVFVYSDSLSTFPYLPRCPRPESSTVVFHLPPPTTVPRAGIQHRGSASYPTVEARTHCAQERAVSQQRTQYPAAAMQEHAFQEGVPRGSCRSDRNFKTTRASRTAQECAVQLSSKPGGWCATPAHIYPLNSHPMATTFIDAQLHPLLVRYKTFTLALSSVH